MDTQIWYSVFCTMFGGLYGILHHLGEVRGKSFCLKYHVSELITITYYRFEHWEC